MAAHTAESRPKPSCGVAEPLPGLTLPPASLSLQDAVWGIDPSSRRVSVAAVKNGLEWVETLSLPKGWDECRKFSAAHEALVPWLGELGREVPSHVFVEEPFLPRDHRQQPTHVWMFGVVLAALGSALPAGVKVRLIGAPSWKCRALGKGHGRAKKPEIMEWARSVAHYQGDLEDEADAVGVATAGAVLISGEPKQAAA